MRFGVLVGAIEEDEIGGRKKSSCNKTRVVVRKRNRAGRIATCYKCRKKQLLVPGFGQYLKNIFHRAVNYLDLLGVPGAGVS
jgi:hypothetical protein